MGTLSFQAPAAGLRVGAPSLVSMTAITPGDVGTTKPLGVYDPLQLMTKNPEKYRRFQEMEIKPALLDGRVRARVPDRSGRSLAGIPFVRRGHQVLGHAGRHHCVVGSAKG